MLSTHLLYILKSIKAQSSDSFPPAPGWIFNIAFLWSSLSFKIELISSFSIWISNNLRWLIDSDDTTFSLLDISTWKFNNSKFLLIFWMNLSLSFKILISWSTLYAEFLSFQKLSLPASNSSLLILFNKWTLSKITS